MTGRVTSAGLHGTSQVDSSTKARRALSAAEQKQLMEACEEFESIFTHMLLRSMRRSVPKVSLIHGGTGEDIFQDLLDEQIAIDSSKTGQMGLARIMFDQLTRQMLK
jgi:flagellar protein FlgJ